MKDVKSVNPVSREEIPQWIEALKKKMSNEVPGWLKGRDVIFAATGQASMFKLCCDCLHSIAKARLNPRLKIGLLEPSSFTAEDARSALDSFVNLTDDEIAGRINFPASADGSDLLIPKLVLLCAVLEKTGIKEVKTVKVVGSCAGLAIDNAFWKFQYDMCNDDKLNIGDTVQITCSAAGNRFMKIANVIEHFTSSPICSLFNYISYFDIYKVKLLAHENGADTGEDSMSITRNNLKRIFRDEHKIL